MKIARNLSQLKNTNEANNSNIEIYIQPQQPHNKIN